MLEIPKHHNRKYCNTTLYFKTPDSRTLWERNMKNLEKRKWLSTFGWDTEDSIIYRYNSHGYRSGEFDNRSSFIALGCSYTEGIGLKDTQIWHSILSKKINKHIWNLGVSGASLDSIYRLLSYYITYLNVEGVFLLEPPDTRLELFADNEPFVYMPEMPDSIIFKQWVTDENNIFWARQKNIDAIKFLCNQQQIPLFIKTQMDLIKCNSTEMARDEDHLGCSHHTNLAELFATEYNEHYN